MVIAKVSAGWLAATHAAVARARFGWNSGTAATEESTNSTLRWLVVMTITILLKILAVGGGSGFGWTIA